MTESMPKNIDQNFQGSVFW